MKATFVTSTTHYYHDRKENVLENFKSNKRAILNYDLQTSKLESRIQGTFFKKKSYTEIVPAAFKLIERVKKDLSPNIPRIEVKLLNEKHLAENYINQMEKTLGKFSIRPVPGVTKEGKYIVKIQTN